MNVASASRDMKRTTDEGSGAMERVVYIHHLPTPTAFDPNPTPLKCVCLCAGPNRGVCEKACIQVMSSFTHKHTHTQIRHMHIHVHMYQHTLPPTQIGNWMGKCFTHRYMPSKLYLRPFSFLTADYLKWQCKYLFYQIALFKFGKVEISLKIYSDFAKSFLKIAKYQSIFLY